MSAKTGKPGGLVIAAPASGSGKTTLTLGLLAAYRAQGLDVRAFKNGPDYIDPAFHTAASGKPSFNLDSWAMEAHSMSGLVSTADGADLIIAEGSMGLFDGVATPGACGNGASADMAAMMGWPVVLVLDVSGQAQSAAAIAKGFATFRPDVQLAGVILNRVASPRHEALARAGMAQVGIEVLGVLPRQTDLTLPERHLGLVQAGEHEQLHATLAALAAFIGRHVALERLLQLAAGSSACTPLPFIAPPGQRIALAQDRGFSFIYPHLLTQWRRAGADILPFSPLADEAPHPTSDLCWLPGGYPELHAGVLANARHFLDGLRQYAQTHPVHGECGGYMVMGETLTDAEGVTHRMAGLLGLQTSFAKRRMHLGYRLATLDGPMPGRKTGQRLRGHEFHYATITAQPDQPLAHVVDANGAPVPETGSRRGTATGTFFHFIADVT
ncbi:cobyrinate a,c-diamide synthase [Acetobacter suratthaniensis]|uniref:Cobyrinate a,c-diamide synthase n=1 Tax=Acetobacter suratthaniensis TaxID=1502841 RepID=A0ABS3LLX1_9PROT|nr:cobyrinate a,c-diamide synthase [Acetobacter suratthaniensis]MBO1328363.1 cobyrinate a,c-diamide synthase [Acetobacter suratthaniensis]MCX2566486.1 cobyrinate a,c-diamide synthase [Acetobacter suratthaniensis]